MATINFNENVFVVATAEKRDGFVEKEIIRVYNLEEADELANSLATILKKKYDGRGYWLSVLVKEVENFDNPHRGGRIYKAYMDSQF